MNARGKAPGTQGPVPAARERGAHPPGEGDQKRAGKENEGGPGGGGPNLVFQMSLASRPPKKAHRKGGVVVGRPQSGRINSAGK